MTPEEGIAAKAASMTSDPDERRAIENAYREVAGLPRLGPAPRKRWPPWDPKAGLRICVSEDGDQI